MDDTVKCIVLFICIEYGLAYSAWDESGPLYFYNRDEPFYEFTNFYMDATPIMIDAVEWKTTEHYFQAQKFVGTPYVEVIRTTFSPREAFNISRDPVAADWRRDDWETVKENIMRKALWEKFTQKRHLRTKLLGTQQRDLVERSPYDSYWGDGGNGTGHNRLGELLMELRSKLQRRLSTNDMQRDGVIKSSHQASGQTSNPVGRDSILHHGVITATGSPSLLDNKVGSGVMPESNELVRRPLHGDSGEGSKMEEDESDLIDLKDNSTTVDSEKTIDPKLPPFSNLSDSSILTPDSSDDLKQAPDTSDSDNLMDVDPQDNTEDEGMIN